MPEGDNILRAARTLDRALRGETIERCESSDTRIETHRLTGQDICGVEARGKHLLVRLADGQVLDTHLRMKGSWHIYRPGERWQKSDRAARLVLHTRGWVAVCFNAPVVALLSHDRRSPVLSALGPDVLDPQVSDAALAERFARHPGLSLGEALLRQHISAGIGNVYKSEALFLEGLDPWITCGECTHTQLRALLSRVRGLMRRNLRGAPRRTRFACDGPRHWVYERGAKPCLRCGAAIRTRRQGEDGRSTWYCTCCQPGPNDTRIDAAREPSQ